MLKTFIPDNDAPPTPFNTRRTKNKDGSFNATAVSMASTIQGISQRNARMWQIIAIAAVCYSLFVTTYEILRPRPQTVPVVVTVDSEGQANYVGKIDKNYWGTSKIPENAKTYQIKRLVANMYTWVIDRSAQNSYIKECEYICQGNAVTQLNAFFTENNPFNYIGRRTQSVKMEEPLKQTDRTYVMYYDVNTFAEGRLERQRRFSMLVTIDYFQESPENNPLGIYISSFDIKEVAK